MIRERERQTASGLLMLLLFFVILGVGGLGVKRAIGTGDGVTALLSGLLIATDVLLVCGLFTVNPNQGVVLQLFGAYRGTVKNEGLRWANPFYSKRRISQRVRNFESAKLKVNDTDGNPIEIAAVVVWRVWTRQKRCSRWTTTRTT